MPGTGDGATADGSLQPMAPAGRVTTPDGVAVAYYDLGGNGPPLLLAHATGFCGPVLAPLAAHLRAQFNCVALDLRALAHLGLDRPFGFGHSCGGAALFLAEEARLGTFRALYCFEPVVYPG